MKVVTYIPEKEKVIGFHILSPNAGEITQGMALAIKVGLTKKDLDNTVGIHPTIAEVIKTINFSLKNEKKLKFNKDKIKFLFKQYTLLKYTTEEDGEIEGW